ncbi:MAG: sigma-70 family RNA polymerase sigma factor [Firmicutes bacterium]|nr:sigma-70 family RNA polymerase sigma factor [Bacillota bacterium]
MKTPYKLNGNLTEIEVNEEVAETLADFHREEKNYARKERWRKEVSIEALYAETGWEPQDETVDILGDYLAKEEVATLRCAIKQLNEKQQRLVQLYYYEQKTMPQIAKQLGVSKMAISKQLSVVHKDLKNIFEKL